MTTVFGSAPIIRATSFPTETGMSHQPSAHARTPRVAQMSAYLCKRSKVARGIAPRLCEIRYTDFSRMGNSERHLRSWSVNGLSFAEALIYHGGVRTGSGSDRIEYTTKAKTEDSVFSTRSQPIPSLLLPVLTRRMLRRLAVIK